MLTRLRASPVALMMMSQQALSADDEEPAAGGNVDRRPAPWYNARTMLRSLCVALC